MVDELVNLEKLLFNPQEQKITSLSKDLECNDYLGFNLKVVDMHIKFRKSKITPTKLGQFVTLWKRNIKGQTEPFHMDDDFQIYIICCQQDSNVGFFVFPKIILGEKNVLTSESKAGKRGFRVYPDWVKTNNKQAKATQKWQKAYFLNCSLSTEDLHKRYQAIIIEIDKQLIKQKSTSK